MDESHRSNPNIEREANYFAVCLLMPKELFLKALEKYPISLADDENAKQIAKIFEVSISAVIFRWTLLVGVINR